MTKRNIHQAKFTSIIPTTSYDIDENFHYIITTV